MPKATTSILDFNPVNLLFFLTKPTIITYDITISEKVLSKTKYLIETFINGMR